MQTHFTTLCWWWLRSRCLSNPCQSDIWRLMTARRNSYQPVLFRIYRNCAIVGAWLPFVMCRICILRALLSGWSFLFMIYANCASIQPRQDMYCLCYHPYLVSCCSVIPTSCKYKLLVPSWSSYCFSQHTHPHSCKTVIGLILPASKSTGYLYHCSQTYSIQIKMNLLTVCTVCTTTILLDIAENMYVLWNMNVLRDAMAGMWTALH